MLKKIISILATTILFLPNVFAKQFETKSNTIELSAEFLDSLNQEQRLYLEGQLRTEKEVDYSNLIDEESDFLFIDMDEVEMAQIADDPTTQTFPER